MLACASTAVSITNAGYPYASEHTYSIFLRVRAFPKQHRHPSLTVGETGCLRSVNTAALLTPWTNPAPFLFILGAHWIWSSSKND